MREGVHHGASLQNNRHFIYLFCFSAARKSGHFFQFLLLLSTCLRPGTFSLFLLFTGRAGRKRTLRGKKRLSPARSAGKHLRGKRFFSGAQRRKKSRVFSGAGPGARKKTFHVFFLAQKQKNKARKVLFPRTSFFAFWAGALFLFTFLLLPSKKNNFLLPP